VQPAREQQEPVVGTLEVVALPNPEPAVEGTGDPAEAIETAAVNTANTSKKVKDKHRKGAAGVAALNADSTGAQKIAAKHGYTVDKLKKELETEADLAVDMEAQELVYSCEGLAIPTDVVSNTSAYADSLEPNYADAFKLHSRPGSTRIIYLDFDGHYATNTAWNSTGTVYTPPYDTDGNPASFTNTEMSNIVSIWRAVAEVGPGQGVGCWCFCSIDSSPLG
jgi:hypothetical protein